MSERTLYLHCRKGDIAPLVLLTGDPARVERGRDVLQGAHKVGQNREFWIVTGTHRGTPVTLASAGIGAPSTAIAVHELVSLGARAVVRIGTMMGVGAPLQSVVLSTGSARFEGASARYLPREYPAIPDWRLTQALAATGEQAGLDIRLGLTATFDAFYPDMAPDRAGLGALDLAPYQHAGVLAMDMESALLFALGMVLRVAAAAMCLVTVQAAPHVHLDAAVRADLDQRLVQAALDGIVAYGETL